MSLARPRHPLRLAASILSADFARLAEEAAAVAAVADLLHVDVMDGHFVDNLTIGPVVVEWLRRATDLPLATHLQLTNPRTYAPKILAAGADAITFHPGTDPDPAGLVALLKDTGAEVGVAVRPTESVDDLAELLPAVDHVVCMTVEPGFPGQKLRVGGIANVARAARQRDEMGLGFRIEVDGGVNPATVSACVAAGADTLVAGSAIFGVADRAAAARAILDAARATFDGADAAASRAPDTAGADPGLGRVADATTAPPGEDGRRGPARVSGRSRGASPAS